MNPKKDMYGLGFDPFKDAPEFRGKVCHRLVHYFSMNYDLDWRLKVIRWETCLKYVCYYTERKREHDEETTHVSQGGWRGHALALKKPSLFRPNGTYFYFAIIDKHYVKILL